MSISRKLCIGCDTYKNNVCLVEPTIIRKGIKKMCPCRTCLVKVMCDNTCKEYKEYIIHMNN